MRTQLKNLLIIFSAAVFLSCQQSTPRLTAEDEATIRTASEAYVKLVRYADWKTLDQLITDDVIWMRPNAPALEGRQALMDWVEANWSAIPEFELTPVEIEVLGDIAFVRGTYKSVSGEVTVVGKYMEIRRRQADGTWPIARTIWNRDAPADQ